MKKLSEQVFPYGCFHGESHHEYELKARELLSRYLEEHCEKVFGDLRPTGQWVWTSRPRDLGQVESTHIAYIFDKQEKKECKHTLVNFYREGTSLPMIENRKCHDCDKQWKAIWKEVK